jgi:hypothetical protein
MLKSFSSSRKVVFSFPSFASSEATAPLGVLAVATPLIRAGYQVVLVDSTITSDYKKRVLEEVHDAVCLGISLVTGPMIRETVEIARAVKEWNPEFPIILGGWHPSLLPDQTLQAECVDYIVRGQGGLRAWKHFPGFAHGYRLLHGDAAARSREDPSRNEARTWP